MHWVQLIEHKECRHVNFTNYGSPGGKPLRLPLKKKIFDRISWQPLPLASSGFIVFMPKLHFLLAAPSERVTGMGQETWSISAQYGHLGQEIIAMTRPRLSVALDCEVSSTHPSSLPHSSSKCQLCRGVWRLFLPITTAPCPFFKSVMGIFLNILLFFCSSNSLWASALQRTQTDTLWIWNFSLIII